MDPKSTELAEEQAYFDVAHKHRERRRAELGEVPTAAANAGAAKRLRFWVKAKKEAASPADTAVAFGRIDDESDPPLYIGNEIIADEDREVLVVNWQAPAAARYYEATHADPHGLVRKRSFATTGNVITDFEDVVFAQLAADVLALEGADPFLLAALDMDRTGTLRGIVSTIHAAQYELIRAPLDQVLVIEGGPGTGKTVVALHRVSWLLFNHRDRLRPAEVLVVGPQPAFTRYIRNVLPGTGDVDVVQQDIGQLAPAVVRGRAEPAEVRRLKGDARMAGLLRRALEARIGTPEAAERMRFDGRFVTLSGDEVGALVAAAREAPGGYAQRRRILRDRLLDLVRERGAPADRDRLVPLENLVDRLWPQLSPAAFVRGLLGSRARLAAAAGGEFTADELALLHRRGADRLSREVWSAADLPLLDEAEDLISGVPAPYAHIVVDEAQDLSPMQLRSIARRSTTGSLTVVGDLAQSTGAWARDRWDEVLAHLPAKLPHSVARLKYGYRVPRQVYELAAQLLPPETSPVTVVRDGPAAPGVHRVDAGTRAGRAVNLAGTHAEAGRFVGLICPPACRAELEAALAAGGVAWSGGELGAGVNLVAPVEAKGLEFDAVVVVEPEEIVAGDERGLRMLFVALTRTTRYLDIVCVGEPVPLSVPARIPQPRTEPDPLVEPAQLDGLAQEIATIVLSGAPAPLWDEVLHRAAGILDRQADRAASSGRHRRD